MSKQTSKNDELFGVDEEDVIVRSINNLIQSLIEHQEAQLETITSLQDGLEQLRDLYHRELIGGTIEPF